MPNIYNLEQYDEHRNLTPQWGFYTARGKIQFFGGAYANGKTTALVIKALRVAKDYPGANLLLARETYPKLNDTLRKVFLEWCPASWVRRRPTKDDNTLYMTNGSVVNFRYVAQRGRMTEDGNTTSNLLSATYDFIGVDQAEDPGITEKDINDLMGRLRGQTPYQPSDEYDETMPDSGPRWLCLTSNPTHNWLYKKLIRPLKMYKEKGIRVDDLLVDPDTGEPIIELYEGSVYSNKNNLPADFIRSLEIKYQGQMRDRYVMGEWAGFEGLVYAGWNAGVHELSRVKLLQHLEDAHSRGVMLRLEEGYDFGLGSPSCYLLSLVDSKGRVIIIDGFYEKDFHYTDQANAIMQLRAKYSHLFTRNSTQKIKADPAIFKQTVIAKEKQTGIAVAQLFKDEGIRMRPASNDIINGIAKVNGYIYGHPDVTHITSGVPPGPLLYIAEELEWFSGEIHAYYWKRSTLGDLIDIPMDRNDHAMDALKYLLSDMPEVAKTNLKEDENYIPPWLRWHEMSDAQAKGV